VTFPHTGAPNGAVAQNASLATAQETFRTMMKELVGPGLREMGFKGSGQNFSLPSPDYWALLAFQRSAWSDSTALHFTINVLVVERQLWEQMKGERSYVKGNPTASTLWGDFVWQHRMANSSQGVRTCGGRWPRPPIPRGSRKRSYRPCENLRFPAVRAQMT
jgi:Domain of unknown function (DUF4304)